MGIDISGLVIYHQDENNHRTAWFPGMALDTAPDEVKDEAARGWTQVAVDQWQKENQGEPAPAPRDTARMHRADFLLALLAAGFLPQVEAFMAGPDVSQECKILWNNTTMFHRNDPLLNQMAGVLGFTDEDLDRVFGIGGTDG